MAKPRVTATDRLSNVIEVAELGRRTGLLSVERSGPMVEVGEIYFHAGQPIYAAVGPLRGRDAISSLARWGACRFAFEANAPAPTPNVEGVLPSMELLDSQRGSRPNLGGNSSYPGAYPSAPSGSSPSHGGPWHSPPNPASSGVWSAPNLGAPPGGDAGQFPFQTATPSQQGAARRPRRAPDARDLMTIVTTYNLSRGHRTLLLLANGQHTIQDLVRLSSKPLPEVAQLLDDLESYGLIYYY